MNEPLPLTADDLRVVASALDEIERTELAPVKVLGRIEVFRPDGDDQIGWVTRFDDGDPDMGWGFVPEAGA